ncbi:hypothetical protein [Pseudomonas frederiksbergensis]|uniref:hypothetical protein n=1 Tax=Pseudomonas frederiksbergensis TaxID=104087 RepID=UPI003D96A3A5
MIRTLISKKLTPTEITTLIKTSNMTAEIKDLISNFNIQPTLTKTIARRAGIMNITNPHTGNITLHCTDIGNISIKVPHVQSVPSPLYSVPGQSILFAINKQSFIVHRYTVENDRLTVKDAVIVDESNPLPIDGAQTLYDCDPTGQGHNAFIGSINLPDRSADISVFDRTSLRKIAWFPHDDSAARYLVSLELLEAAEDPGAGKVAEELIYHYHPAIAWKAFQVLYQADQEAALNYIPLLRNLQNRRLDHLLDQFKESA